MNLLRHLLALVFFLVMVGWALWGIVILSQAQELTSLQLRILLIGFGVTAAWVFADWVMSKVDNWLYRRYFSDEDIWRD